MSTTQPQAAQGKTSSRQVAGQVAKTSLVLAAGIGLSRVLGFVRDVLMARLFGTTMQSEAFIVAFRLPNLFRDLVAEGAVTSAFVPVLSWHRARGDDESFWRLSSALLLRLLVILITLGVAGAWAAPLIVRSVAPGFAADPEKFALTVQLTRILFPFIALVGLWAYFMGLLNTLRHFAIPALGSAILNLAMILACVFWVPRVSIGVIAVAMSVMIGGIIQLLVELPPALKRGFKWRWCWSHPGASEVLRLFGPRVLGSAVYQLSVLVDTALASFGSIVGAGAVAALYFSNRLVQLPLALFGNAFAQASLPTLAEQAAHQDFIAFRETLLAVTRMVAFVVLPSSIGLMVLAFPIVGGLFERGAFTHQATLMTSQTLICYCLGLLAYSLTNVLTGAFYAVKDTATPVRLSIEALVVNVAFSVLLMWPLKVSGLALAAAISNGVNAYRLVRFMEKRLSAPILLPLIQSARQTAIASLAMGGVCWLGWALVGRMFRPWISLSIVIALGMSSYLMICRWLGIRELESLLRWLRRVPLISRLIGA